MGKLEVNGIIVESMFLTICLDRASGVDGQWLAIDSP